jgi:hypothetical protein
LVAASRTPEEAGMTLRKKPFKPSSLPVTPVLPVTREMPVVWLPYCGGRPDTPRLRCSWLSLDSVHFVDSVQFESSPLPSPLWKLNRARREPSRYPVRARRGHGV